MENDRYRELMDLARNSQKYGSIERYMTAAQRAESQACVREVPLANTLKKPVTLTWEQLNTEYF